MNQKNKGFTLIETIVTISLFGITIAGAMGLFGMVIKNKLQTEKKIKVRRQIGEVLSRVGREIINAQDFNREDFVEDPDDTDWMEIDSGKIFSFQNKDNIGTTILCDNTNKTIEMGNEILLDGIQLGLTADQDIVCKFRYRTNNEKYGLEFSMDLGQDNKYKTYAVIRNIID